MRKIKAKYSLQFTRLLLTDRGFTAKATITYTGIIHDNPRINVLGWREQTFDVSGSGRTIKQAIYKCWRDSKRLALDVPYPTEAAIRKLARNVEEVA